MRDPLPLTAFESMMFHNDCPAYPLTFSMVCTFVGSLDPVGVQRALEHIRERHPLLNAKVEQYDSGLCWVWHEPSDIPVCWESSGWTEPLSPVEYGGLRVTVLAGKRSRLLFEFHHCYTDGDGAGLFILDFLKAYHEVKGGEKQPWGRVDFEPLLHRARIPWPKPVKHKDPLPWWKRLRFVYDFLTCLPEQIAGDRSVRAAPRMFSCHVFEPVQTRLMLETLASRNSKLNDVALTLLFQTLARWQEKEQTRPGFRKIRVLVPTSIRQLSDRRMGAANRMSFAFLTRRRSECLENAVDFHQGIREENSFIKRLRPDLSTIAAIDFAGRLGILKLMPLLPFTQSSAIMTNMGDRSPIGAGFLKENGYFRIGNLLLESVTGTPPIRSGTRIALATGRVGERMSVSLRCDPATFSVQKEQELLDLYVKAWEEWVGP